MESVTFWANKKVVKGQDVVDVLADHLVPRTTKLYDLPDDIAGVNLINASSEDKCGNFSFMVRQE